MRIIDADAHVIEPADLWGDLTPSGTSIIDLPATTPMVPCDGAPELQPFLEAGARPEAYLECLDLEGIDTVVLYPSIGLFAPFRSDLDPRDAVRACQVYNDWIAGYCGHAPSRLHGVAVLPLADPAAAAAEARRAHGLRLVAAMVRPNPVHGRDLGDPAYDPVYDTLEELDLPLAVHEGLGLIGPTIGRDRAESFARRHAMSHPLEQMAAMSSLLLDGALERHPGLRVAFLESGTGWLPYWLARLDGHAAWMQESETRSLALSPSEYFHRQCVICTDPDDPFAAWVVAQVGADHVMWASDFPHPDAVFPHAVERFVAESAERGLRGDDLASVLAATPADFYGIPADSSITSCA